MLADHRPTPYHIGRWAVSGLAATLSPRGPTLKTDVLIIGGGLAGAATAYYLARDGVEVTVVERFDLNTQASGSNAGSIHAQIPHLPFMEEGDGWARNFAPTIPLLLESIRMWKGLSDELGADLEVTTPGGLLVAETEGQMRDVERKAAIEIAQGMQIELLDRDQLRRLAPYVSDRMAGGAYSPQEGKANPLKATLAYADAARRRGARFLTFTEVTDLHESAQGFRATSSQGEFSAKRIVDCAGAAAGQIAGMLGVTLPIEGHAIQVSVTEPVAPLIKHLLYFTGGRLTLKQVANGTCLIGGGWPARRSAATGDLAVDLRSLRDNLRIAVHVVPAMAEIQLVRTWPAIVNGTADWKPILGELPGHPGFFINMFPWLGFSAGPVAARIVADLVLGRKPAFDLSAFSALRYG